MAWPGQYYSTAKLQFGQPGLIGTAGANRDNNLENDSLCDNSNSQIFIK